MAQSLPESKHNDDDQIEQIIGGIKNSSDGDSSDSNVVANFSKLLALIPSNLKDFGKYINIVTFISYVSIAIN